jgi:predicted transposase YbfD/YdcC
LSGARFAEAVWTHWAIECCLHLQVDAAFQEDQCRIRKGNADANFSSLRRTVPGFLRNETTARVGIKNKRLTASCDIICPEEVLSGK